MFGFVAQVDWSEGGCSGCVYSGEEDLTTLNGKVSGLLFEIYIFTEK